MSTASEIKLFRFDGSCSIVPHMLLLDLDIPFEPVLITAGPDGAEAADGSVSAAEYRKIHHMGNVPALTIDGVPLTENIAILNYIASLSPQHKSLTGGDDPLTRAQVLSWEVYMSGTMHSYGGGYGLLYRPNKFVDKEELYPMVQEKGRKWLKVCYDRIEKHLEGRDCFIGDDVTIVDFYSVVFWLWGNKQGFKLTENYPNYGRVIQRMEKRKGVREAMVKEQQVFTFDREA
ncbi:glutathione S-transferase [Sarocladium strictum]